MPPLPMVKTPWQEFKEKWGKGCGSPHCGTATRVVLTRGKIPCDICFIGEAPGESENVLGIPFAGPAGKLLDRIVLLSIGDRYRVGFTNVVGCIPREETDDGRQKASEPDHDQCMSCKPRLVEFIELVDPKLIVRVGKLAQEYLDPTWRDAAKFHKPIPFVDIVHPAAIIRANRAQQGLMIQRCVVAVQNAVEEFVSENRV